MTGSTTETLPLRQYLSRRPAALADKGPYAIILCEDDEAVGETIAHHLRAGFLHVLALSANPLPAKIVADPQNRVSNVIYDTRQSFAHVDAVKAVNDAVAPGTWLYYGFNAEFLIYPFLESRSVVELLHFHAEEKRAAMLCFTLDLYPADLSENPSGVDLDHAMFDGNTNFALSRPGAERQLDFHGGLRWRFAEHISSHRQRIDRVALFRAAKGLTLSPDHRFDAQEYNTYACGSHHNLTAAVASFRAAKALVRNPGSRDSITDFNWSNSRPFDWSSQQLMDLGLIEPGQWF